MTAPRLRIAMIGSRGVPATFGGVEHHVEELGHRLVERGHDVAVFCRPNYNHIAATHHRGMRLVYVRTIGSKHLEAIVHATASTLRALLARYDVVHFHGVGPGVVSVLPRLVGGAKVVQTIHGLDGQRAKWGLGARTFLDLSTRLSARVPHTTVVVSQAMREHYRRQFGRECTYIPNGVTALTRRPPDLIARNHGLRAQGYVLFMGRLVPEKRPDELIAAYRDVDTDLPLVIAGGSSYTDGYVTRLRSMAAADDRVVLTGYVYGPEREELYSNAAAFVLPSALEGLPLTLLEAMGIGTPVIASDIAPHREVLGAGGPGARLFATDERAALTAALRGVLAAQPDEQRAARRASTEIVNAYSWDAAVDRLEAVYTGRDVAVLI